MEKTIKISQKANNSKGFGFTLTGGTDKQQPVVVEKVGLGMLLVLHLFYFFDRG